MESVPQKIMSFRDLQVARMKADYLRGMPVQKILDKYGEIGSKFPKPTFYRWIKATQEEKALHNGNMWRNYPPVQPPRKPRKALQFVG